MWEFLFCPQHGVFAPANWALILPALSGAAVMIRAYLRGLFK